MKYTYLISAFLHFELNVELCETSNIINKTCKQPYFENFLAK